MFESVLTREKTVEKLEIKELMPEHSFQHIEIDLDYVMRFLAFVKEFSCEYSAHLEKLLDRILRKCETAGLEKIQQCLLKKLTLHWNNHRVKIINGITSGQWRDFRRLCPEVHVDLIIEPFKHTRRTIELILPSDIPLRSVSYVVKSFKQAVEGATIDTKKQLDHLFGGIRSCGLCNNLEEMHLTLLCDGIAQSESLDQFVRECPRLETLEIRVPYPATTLCSLLWSWIKNRPQVAIDEDSGRKRQNSNGVMEIREYRVQESPWADLPTEPMRMIYSYLTFTERSRMSLACKNWWSKFHEPYNWSRITFNFSMKTYPDPVYPVVKFANMHWDSIRHVEVIGTVEENPDCYLQFCLFVQEINRGTNLVSVSLVNLKGCFVNDGTASRQDVLNAVDRLFKKQIHLKYITIAGTLQKTRDLCSSRATPDPAAVQRGAAATTTSPNYLLSK